MKITLKRKLELKSAIVYLKLNNKVLREDIKGYLNSEFDFRSVNEIVEQRVKKYLLNEGFYGRDYTLTTKGREAKETGFVMEPEEGTYQIWYTKDDPLFGNRAFYFTRIIPKKSPDTTGNIKEGNLNLSGEFKSLPIVSMKNIQGTEFTIEKISKWDEEKEPSFIEMKWIWNGIENSTFNFRGFLKTANTEKNGNPHQDRIDDTKAIDLNIPLDKHISGIIPDWNSETGRYRFKLENVRDNDIYLYFEYSGDRPREGYDSCRYDKLPLEPYNLEEAKKWRDKIIKLKLADSYMHPDDFTDYIIESNQKEGFSAYSEHLDADMPDARQYLPEIDPAKKSDRALDFWHLAAPMDLNIGFPQSLQQWHFSLKKGEHVSLNSIAEKLFWDKTKLKKILYYDKYVTSYYQQRTIFALLECFDCAENHIITDILQDNFHGYLAKKKSITLKNINDVYKDKKDAPHDRYIVFNHDDVLDAWVCTNSIDYIRFYIKGEIPSGADGTILKSVNFTKVDPRVLDEELKNYLEGK